MEHLTHFQPSAKVICDSSAFGSRLTTMVVEFHRYVLAEFNTHRMFSRNGASSRAIPVHKMIEKARVSNVEPLEWGQNQTGMQAWNELTGEHLAYAQQAWNIARARAIDVAEAMVDANLHKQIVNRILEPFLPMTMVVTGDERAYANFFSQRCHPMAAPEIRALAYRMQEAYVASKPLEKKVGDWHLPFYRRELATIDILDCVKACVARCARVSYDNHDGNTSVEADLSLYEKLVTASPPHLSPMEHVAEIKTDMLRLDTGNFKLPWYQHRKYLENTR